jgi:hypothetical protein
LAYIFRLVYQHFCKRYFAVLRKLPVIERPVGLMRDGPCTSLGRNGNKPTN